VALRRQLQTIAVALAGRPGARLAARSAIAVSRSTLLRLAPEGVQVADRYHLWANLGEAVEKTVWAHRSCLAETAPQPEVADTVAPTPDRTLDVNGRPRPLVTRKQQRHAAIQQLRAQGHSLTAISQQLGVCFRTVQRYAAASLDDLLAPALHRSSVLDDYVHQRRADGLTDAAMLHAELQTRGWRGSLRTVQRYLRPLRPKAITIRPVPAPKPRRVTRWIMTKPEHLDSEHSAALAGILTRCPELRAVRGHVAAFAAMMSELGGERLDGWMRAVETDDLPALHTLGGRPAP
jgi:hypothetical protein